MNSLTTGASRGLSMLMSVECTASKRTNESEIISETGLNKPEISKNLQNSPQMLQNHAQHPGG